MRIFASEFNPRTGRNKQQNTIIMKANTVLTALASNANESIPNQFITLHDRADLVRIFGEGGKVYAIGINGIPEALYMYLYLNVPEQAELFEDLKRTAAKRFESENILDAIGVDMAGQTVAVINVSE